MDALTWALALAVGVAAGAAAGLVPGFHTNTLAALLVAFAPTAGLWGALALLAAAATHGFVSILPSTYVGVPGEESTLSVLPAHRLLLEGQGPQAVRIAADASLASVLAAILLLLPFKWMLAEPGRILATLDAAAPWILVGVLLLLIGQEASVRGPRGAAKAILCIAISAALGHVALGLPLTALVPIPATPLLPLLTGLFGAAGLVHSLASLDRLPLQDPPAPVPRATRRKVAGACARAVAAAGWTAAVPGLTSAVAASVALAGTQDREPRPALAAMSAVGAAHQVFALGILWVALRARTGTTLGIQALAGVEPWTAGRLPHEFALALVTLLCAAIAGWALTLAADRRLRPAWAHIGSRPLALGSLVALTAVVLLLSGPLGLLVLACSTTVGLLPMALGVRRVHLTGALIVPVLLLRLGFTQ